MDVNSVRVLLKFGKAAVHPWMIAEAIKNSNPDVLDQHRSTKC